MSHLCLGLYTKDPTTLAAHVSHYDSDMSKRTGEHLCLRTLPVSQTPVRAELLEHFAGLFSWQPPNTVETLVCFLPCFVFVPWLTQPRCRCTWARSSPRRSRPRSATA